MPRDIALTKAKLPTSFHRIDMPIYEYACPDCGHQGEHMQKLADAALTTCPSCGQANYSKKISAAGFALKGSGWYVTDFRNGSQKSPGQDAGKKTESSSSEKATSPASDGGSSANAASGNSTAAPSPAPASAPAPAPASAPAG